MPFPSLGDLPDPGIEPESLALAGGFLFLLFFTMEPPSRKFYPVETEKNPKGDFIIKIPGVSGNPGQKRATPGTPGCTARPQLPSGEEREGREFLKNLKS